MAEEKIKSCVWLFKIFLKAMARKGTTFNRNCEYASIKYATNQILPNTTHRLCMWHILEKVLERISPSAREDEDFWNALNICVWAYEIIEEFESWHSLITVFQLTSTEWLSTC
jgi:zinc finger SWIM domain-containing protein 3